MDTTGGYQEYAFIADLYDYVTPYRERPDVAFYVEAAVESGGPVLEVGCGTGRVLIPTARAGIDIVGLDLSQSMLEVCRASLSHEPAEVQVRARLVSGDMRAFELGQAFRLATIPFRPFQHLTTVEDQLACLACIRRHLVEGGRLILDLFNPWLQALTSDNVGEELGDEPEFSTPDGRRVVRRHRIVRRDLFNQINDSELIYYVTHPDGQKERLVHAFPMRYLHRYEMEHLLSLCGLKVVEFFGNFDKATFNDNSPEMIFVAEKMK